MFSLHGIIVAEAENKKLQAVYGNLSMNPRILLFRSCTSLSKRTPMSPARHKCHPHSRPAPHSYLCFVFASVLGCKIRENKCRKERGCSPTVQYDTSRTLHSWANACCNAVSSLFCYVSLLEARWLKRFLAHGVSNTVTRRISRHQERVYQTLGLILLPMRVLREPGRKDATQAMGKALFTECDAEREVSVSGYAEA